MKNGNIKNTIGAILKPVGKFCVGLLDMLPWGVILVCFLGVFLGVLSFSQVTKPMNGLTIFTITVMVISMVGVLGRRLFLVGERRYLKHMVQKQQAVIIAEQETLKRASEGYNELAQEYKGLVKQVQRGGVRGMKPDGEESQFLAIPNDKLLVRMSDVRGMPETIKDISELISILNHTNELSDIGAKPPKGVLFTGAPGTGKTLLAKAIAGTCGRAFISVCGPEFVERYVGEGASRIRELFKQARKQAPCIIFIDEIDALCAERGSSECSERDATLNQLLVEMDGFANNDGIFIIGATNRDNIIDSAITRPGRLERTINIPLPTKSGRIDIINYYLKRYATVGLTVSELASKTVGFSPAEIEGLLNSAAIRAVTEGRNKISQEDIDEARFKIIMKGNKREDDRSDEENELIAYHEAGHALVHCLLCKEEVIEVTIIPSTAGTGGVTMIAPKENMIPSKKDIEHKIMALYAGRAAESILCGNDVDITTGASGDIQTASKYIASYIEKWGMSDGLLDYSVFKTEGKSLEQAKILSTELYEKTVKYLTEHKHLLSALADSLVANKTLDSQEIQDILIPIESSVMLATAN